MKDQTDNQELEEQLAREGHHGHRDNANVNVNGNGTIVNKRGAGYGR